MIVIRQMFYEPKKFDGTFEVLSYFFEIIKTWYELFDRCFTKQKIRRNFEVLVYFSKSTKVDYEYDYRQSSVWLFEID